MGLRLRAERSETASHYSCSEPKEATNPAQAKKRRNPKGESALGSLGALLAPYRSTRDLRVARALPSRPRHSRATCPDISTGC